MTDLDDGKLTNLIQTAARPLDLDALDADSLLAGIGDARFVLIGEASHGTHEFYQTRAEITKQLIERHGFHAVAVEADWPDAYRVNRYVRGLSADPTAETALADFKRFPAWMWRNTDVLAFVEWLRRYNEALRMPEARVGFYGLDLYSLYTSIEAVIAYLDQVDPEAARRARERYACFEPFHQNPQDYGLAATIRRESCEDAVVQQLLDLQRHAALYAQRDGLLAEDATFYAVQNARLVKNAEAYYRAMFYGQIESWNLRDRHMAETLDALVTHLEQRSERAKVIVWAHNSHIGDARATELGWRGELTIGQLVREQYHQEVVLVGMSTYTGTVTAASDWGAPAERKWVRPALAGSYEALLHATNLPGLLLPLRQQAVLTSTLDERLERAIGVIYRPETERLSHYFRAHLPRQFDVLLHMQETHAVEPLERTAGWVAGEVPETYPFMV